VRPAARAGGSNLAPPTSPAPSMVPACSTWRRDKEGTLRFVFMTVSLMFWPVGRRFVPSWPPRSRSDDDVGRDVAPAPMILRRLLALCNRIAARRQRMNGIASMCAGAGPDAAHRARRPA